MKFSYRINFFLTAVFAAAIIFAPFAAHNLSSVKADDSSKKTRRFKAAPELSNFILSAGEDGIACRAATPLESLEMSQRPSDIGLKMISKIQPNQQSGLKIMLRGTQQLDAFPDAKAAFIKAAAVWDAVITTPVTLVLDVDFGPNRFGRPFGPGVLGGTTIQPVGANGIYPDVRDQLNTLSPTPVELAVYGQLPSARVPTDLGNIDAISGPSAVFRALGLIDPVADPAGEQSTLGDPPGIGFNSNFPFDFNPNDGIDVNKFDFDGVAVHEIGHALGFSSNTGLRELIPTASISLTVWDLYRLRPGTGTGFGSAQRVLSSGGTQVFFAGSPELQLATGRPDASGGDGDQASHWKSSRFLGGVPIGVMDPRIGPGERSVITDADLRAIDFFGYKVNNVQGFALNLTPGAQTITPGDSASFNVGVQGATGFTDPVNLSVSVSPTDSTVAASLSSAAVTPGGNSTLTVSTTASTPNTTFNLTITGTSGQIVRTATVSLTVGAPDFALALNPLTVSRKQKGLFTVAVNRTGGFAGNVTVTPDAAQAKALKIKITQPSLSTTGTSVSFNFKIKPAAKTGTQMLLFSGRDDSGRVRTATLNLTIQ